MDQDNKIISPNFSQKIILLIVGISLVIFSFIAKTDLIDKKHNLQLLGSSSMNPEVAFSNGKPTVIEFYADWCEVCQEMSPNMIKAKNNYGEKINFVFMNVDNPSSEKLVEQYSVNGIPFLTLFDKEGNFLSSSTGYKSNDEILFLFESLVA